jgi:dephospho-CoA kinase
MVANFEDDKPFVLLVEGNIAAGKSTFVSYFEKLSIIDVIKEPLE